MALATLKIDTQAPIPAANVSTATAVNPGFLRSTRQAKRRSFIFDPLQAVFSTNVFVFLNHKLALSLHADTPSPDAAYPIHGPQSKSCAPPQCARSVTRFDHQERTSGRVSIPSFYSPPSSQGRGQGRSGRVPGIAPRHPPTPPD